MPSLRSKRIFVSAGEASGDETLGALLLEMHSQEPDFRLHGLGGPAAIKQGLSPIFPLDRTALSGIWDVLFNALFLFRMYRRALKEMIQFRPDLVILVDYPGLNLRLARKARSLGFPVLFVAPPQLWIYKNPRRRIARTLEALRGCSVHVLFPFEVEAFAAIHAPVTAGHFLRMAPEKSGTQANPSPRLASGKKVLSLFPGSRLPLILRNLPIWLEHLDYYSRTRGRLWKDSIEIQVLVPAHLLGKVKSWLSHFQGGKFFQEQALILAIDKEEVYSTSTYAIAFPGTITLELALHRIPSLILAILDPFTLTLGRQLLDSRHLGLPNLLLKEEIFPEWSGTAAKLTQQIFSDKLSALEALKPDWNRIKIEMEAILGPESGAKIAAQEGLRLLHGAKIGQKIKIEG